MLRLALAGSVVVLTLLMAVACGGGDSPTSTAAQDGSGGSEVTAVPTSTAAQDGSGGSEVTAAPTSTVAEDSSGSSEATVAEYAVWCAESISESGESGGSGLTWGETAEAYAELIDTFEDKSAPEELNAFHDAAIAFLKTYHDFTRMQDASEPIDSGTAPTDEIIARIAAFIDVAGTLDEKTRSQLFEAGCYSGFL